MPNINLNTVARLLAAAALVAVVPAEAAEFGFDGNIVMNNDLVNVDFTVGAASGAVSLWTDSFQSGLNFDPQLSLWQKVGANYVLVANNDDNNSIAASQGYQDAGIAMSLTAGEYKLTLSASSYQPVGIQLSQGFQFDPFFIPALAITPIVNWNQPSYDPDLNNQKGTFWSVHLAGNGVQSAAISPVPEPSSIVLMLAGLTALASRRRSALAWWSSRTRCTSTRHRAAS